MNDNTVKSPCEGCKGNRGVEGYAGPGLCSECVCSGGGNRDVPSENVVEKKGNE